MRVNAYDAMKETTAPTVTDATATMIVFLYICTSGSAAIASR